MIRVKLRHRNLEAGQRFRIVFKYKILFEYRPILILVFDCLCCDPL